jgi:hypothetical protein
MGRYMIVTLKEENRNDDFIKQLNKELHYGFGAPTEQVFNTWEFLHSEAQYINNAAEGRKQLPDWPRPITAEMLHNNFFWLQVGELHYKLSGGFDVQEAQSAIAVCKWVIATKAQHINTSQSQNYSKKIVAQYLNDSFKEQGYKLSALWQISK